MASEFHAVLIEGIFYTEDGRLRCRQDNGEVITVWDQVGPLLDQVVHFSAHHVPPMPPRLSAWGMGSCLGESRGYCGFGHQNHASRLFNVHGQGTLVGQDGSWWVRRVDGGVACKDLNMVLADHHGRLLMASAMTVDQMRDTVLEAGAGDQVEDLVQRAGDMMTLLTKVRDMTGDGVD